VNIREGEKLKIIYHVILNTNISERQRQNLAKVKCQIHKEVNIYKILLRLKQNSFEITKQSHRLRYL